MHYECLASSSICKFSKIIFVYLQNHKQWWYLVTPAMSPFEGDTPKDLFMSGAQMRWGHNLLLFLVSLKSSPWQWQGFQQDDRHNDSIF